MEKPPGNAIIITIIIIIIILLDNVHLLGGQCINSGVKQWLA